MNKLGQSIKRRMKEIGMTQQELADLCNIRQSSVYEIVSGKTQRTKYVAEIAAALGITVDQLYDYEPGFVVKEPHGQYGYHYAPLIKPDQIKKFIDGETINDKELMPCPVRCSAKAFAIPSSGESVRPFVDNEDILFCDVIREPKHGMVVIALDDDYVVIRRLIFDAGRYYLQVINPDWPTRIKELKSIADVLAVVIGRFTPQLKMNS